MAPKSQEDKKMKTATFQSRLKNLEKKYLDWCAKAYHYNSDDYLWHESLATGRIFFFKKSNTIVENCFYNGPTAYKTPTAYLKYLKSIFESNVSQKWHDDLVQRDVEANLSI
ncbi:hypothetical protein Lepto782_23650 (plasmid) [Leptospira interrogans serovar Canicola]|uniref:Uncharacterized protein n=2 Tax=Leptospira interrogans TaxID=173 RepID=A0AAQ0B129_LEPIR|nr:hypothetical protein [Leptospira interrogans serovar Yeoncheon]QOI45173.1 hypothetical protein Lepto782_23650 [Leptospira interrogans serovar Canicola]